VDTTSSVSRSLIRALCFLAVAMSVYYLTWRALDTFNPHALALSLLLYLAEAYGLAMFLLHIFLTWDTRALERSLGLGPGERLEDAAMPAPVAGSVDVFLPTYNESVSLLRKSVLAAREIRIAHETWVLDDGRRAEVQAMCEELGVGYLTRESNEHAKAGNINAALPRTSGEFIVVLDADFIPLPNLLERTLGHFRDEQLAFVQLPQAFYNVDSIQHVGGDIRSGWHEQSLFYDVIQPGKNRWNSAFWCGSPAVLRRSALESVGGAATATITEDILTSMRMHARGWRTLYHNEVLAVGVAPGDLDGFRTQRLRWAQGSMQILRSRENPLLKRGLSLPQRINYLASMTTYFQALQLAVLVAMPALVLFTGQAPIAHLGASFFLRFVPYLVLTMLASKLLGGSRQRMLWDQYFSFLRLFTFLRALPVLVTGGRKLRFRVTPKTPGESARSALYPHVGVALVNVGVIAALLAQPGRFATGTTVAVSICAAFVAGTYMLAVARLWRRVYRRHHYRVALELPALLHLDDGFETAAQTENISFGGLSLLTPSPVQRGARTTIRVLLGGATIALSGTVMSCSPSGEGYRVGVQFAALAIEDEKLLLMSMLDAAIGASRAQAQVEHAPLGQLVPARI
jgi:cellulose synthase/poly-beta-1,6-N-acetylglucosamine synthase-like glycosyltransferase